MHGRYSREQMSLGIKHFSAMLFRKPTTACRPFVLLIISWCKAPLLPRAARPFRHPCTPLPARHRAALALIRHGRLTKRALWASRWTSLCEAKLVCCPNGSTKKDEDSGVAAISSGKIAVSIQRMDVKGVSSTRLMTFKPSVSAFKVTADSDLRLGLFCNCAATALAATLAPRLWPHNTNFESG